MNDSQRGWGPRFDAWTKRNPALVIFLFVALVISSLLTISGALSSTYAWYDNHLHWRQQEYDKITKLRAGFSLEKFKESLGSPIFVETLEKQKLTDNTFKGRDYWVSAISDREGTVVQYAVTSCDKQFRPTFILSKGASDEAALTLNVTTLDQMSQLSPEADYFLGMTSNTYIFEVFYGGNPGLYKTYAWGVNDACPSVINHGLYQELNRSRGQYRGPVTAASSALKQSRKGTVINTYAETAPAWKIVHGSDGQIGVDRILVRTVD